MGEKLLVEGKWGEMNRGNRASGQRGRGLEFPFPFGLLLFNCIIPGPRATQEFLWLALEMSLKCLKSLHGIFPPEFPQMAQLYPVILGFGFSVT